MLTDEEIVRRLRIIRHSPAADRYGRRAASINGIAAAIGISREYLYRIIRGEQLGPRARSELSRVFSCEPMTGARTGGRL